MQFDAVSLLIDGGLINEGQLQEALAESVQQGGSLIENLVRLGHVKDSEVASLLATKLQLPVAEPFQFQNLPVFVTRLVPTKVVETHRLIPVMLDHGVLHVAISDPTDRAALEEVSFATGYVASPIVAPASLIEAAMARYYGLVPSATRPKPSEREAANPAQPAEPVSGELDQLFLLGPAETPSAIPLTRRKDSALRAAGTIADAIRLEMSRDGKTPAGQPSSRETGPLQAMKPAVALGSTPSVPDQTPRATSPEPAPEDLQEPLWDAEAARLAIGEATHRDEVARILVRYALHFMPRVMLFIARDDILVGWMGAGPNVPDKSVKGIMIPFSSPSVFKTVKETETDYFGSLPRTTVNDMFLAALGGVRPNQVLLVPITVRQKLICILYGDCGTESGFCRDLGPLHLFVVDTANSFERIILQRKMGRSVLR